VDTLSSFTSREVRGPASATKTLKVVNKGVAPAEYAVAYQVVNALPGVVKVDVASGARPGPGRQSGRQPIGAARP
jgi:hypothetical protein